MAEIASSGSTVQSISPTITDWWLKDPDDASANITIDVSNTTFQTEEDEEMAVFKPLGRIYPVVVSDVIHGQDGELEIEFTTANAYEAFRTLRNRQRTLLLQSGWLSQQWYIRLGKTLKTVNHNTNPIWRKIRIEYIEVDAP